MISPGLETATEEITLVLFTTLAPSGLFALTVLSLYLLLVRLSPKQRNSVDAHTIIPNIITLAGLVASATHLGNPENALYVLTRVGKSPLSNEVFAVILCMFFVGVYWLYSFSLRPKPILQKVCLGIIAVLGVAAVSFIAVAYDVKTIITWNTVYVPINLWLNAIIGGSMLAILTLQAAKAPGFFIARSSEQTSRLASVRNASGTPQVLLEKAVEAGAKPATSSAKMSAKVSARVSKLVLGACVAVGVALIANTICMLLQNASLASIENSLLAATDLVPYYLLVILAFALMGFVGLSIYLFYYIKRQLPSLPKACLACILVFVGIFLTRFTFYMMHMTVGLAV